MVLILQRLDLLPSRSYLRNPRDLAMQHKKEKARVTSEAGERAF
jgi:hypothetical protein